MSLQSTFRTLSKPTRLGRVQRKYTPSTTTFVSGGVTSRPFDTLWPKSGFWARMGTTFEVAISKIFPAGFGWQAASVVASDAGMKPTELGFWLATGAGDLVGVFVGHVTWYVGKILVLSLLNSMANKNFEVPKLTTEISTGTWLATAAFCSGTAWQPIVNFCVGPLGLSFAPTFLVTVAICGSAFYGGLRFGRNFYPKIGLAVEAPNYSNWKEDAALSLAIGNASGLFVGTDITVPLNPFTTFVGVHPYHTPLEGCILAGKSTIVGYSVSSTLQNSRPDERPRSFDVAIFTNLNQLDQDHRISYEYHEFVGFARAVGDKILEVHPELRREVHALLFTDTRAWFEKMDSDKDGRITPEEFSAGIQSMFAAIRVFLKAAENVEKRKRDAFSEESFSPL